MFRLASAWHTFYHSYFVNAVLSILLNFLHSKIVDFTPNSMKSGGCSVHESIRIWLNIPQEFQKFEQIRMRWSISLHELRMKSFVYSFDRVVGIGNWWNIRKHVNICFMILHLAIILEKTQLPQFGYGLTTAISAWTQSDKDNITFIIATASSSVLTAARIVPFDTIYNKLQYSTLRKKCY